MTEFYIFAPVWDDLIDQNRKGTCPSLHTNSERKCIVLIEAKMPDCQIKF
jgi:hypothetical protein